MLFRRKALTAWTVVSFVCSFFYASSILPQLRASNLSSVFDTKGSILDILELTAASKLTFVLVYSNLALTLCIWAATYVFPEGYSLFPRDLTGYSSRSIRLPEIFLIYSYCLDRNARFIVITWIIVYIFVSLILFRLRDIQDSLFSKILQPQNGMQVQNEAIDTVKAQGSMINSSVVKTMYISGFLGLLCLKYGLLFKSMDVALVLLPAVLRSFLEGYHTFKRSRILFNSFKVSHVSYKNARELTQLDFVVAAFHTLLQICHFFHFLWLRSFIFRISDIPLLLVSQRYIVTMSERRNRMRWFNVLDREFEHIFPNASESQLLSQDDNSLPASYEPILETTSSSSTIEQTSGERLYKTCVICLEPLCSGKVLPQCGHVLHRVCLLRYLFSDNSTCPICRKPFKNENDGSNSVGNGRRYSFSMSNVGEQHNYSLVNQAIKALVRDMPFLRMRRNSNSTNTHGLVEVFGNVDRSELPDDLNLFTRDRIGNPRSDTRVDPSMPSNGMTLQGTSIFPSNPATDSSLAILYEMFPALDRSALKHHFLVVSRGNIDATIDAAVSGSIPTSAGGNGNAQECVKGTEGAAIEPTIPPFVCPMETHRLYPQILKYIISDEPSNLSEKPTVSDKFAYTKWRQCEMVEINRKLYLEKLMHELLQESIEKREKHMEKYGQYSAKSLMDSSIAQPLKSQDTEIPSQDRPEILDSVVLNTLQTISAHSPLGNPTFHIEVSEDGSATSSTSMRSLQSNVEMRPISPPLVSSPPLHTMNAITSRSMSIAGDVFSSETTSSMFPETSVPSSPPNIANSINPDTVETARQKRLQAALRRVS